MFQSSGKNYRYGPMMRLACCLIIAIGLLGFFDQSGRAQDADPSVPAAVEPTALEDITPTPQPAEDLPPAPTETSGPEATVATDPPTEVPTVDAATETPTDAPITDAATETPADAPTTDAVTGTPTDAATGTDVATAPSATEIVATATPVPPTLLGTPDLAPSCALPDGSTDVVSSGATVTYDCVYSMKLTGTQLAPAWITIDWSLAVTATGGWTAQLLPKLPDAVWVEAGTNAPPLLVQTGVSRLPATDVVNAFDSLAELAFQVRLTRPSCNLQPVEIQFAISGTPTLPGHDDATVVTAAVEPSAQPYKLAPALAPIPEPSIALSGSLDFGTVALTASGPRKMPDPEVLTLTVAGLDHACGVWNLTLASTTLDAKTGRETAVPTLRLTAVDGQTAPIAGSLLDGAAPAFQIQAGPVAPALVTYQLRIALVLPDQPALTAYRASLRVSLDAAKPLAQAPAAPDHG